MLKSFLPTGEDADRQWHRRGATAGGVMVAYVVLALILFRVFGGVYTATAMGSKIWWLFLPVAVLLAVAGFHRTARWSVAAFLIAVIIGEMIGSPIYQFQADYLAAKLRDRHYEADWTPIQPAFWIAFVLYLYVTLAAGFVEYREKREAGELVGLTT